MSEATRDPSAPLGADETTAQNSGSRKGKTLLPGHTLDYEGRAYVERSSCGECAVMEGPWAPWHSTAGHGHGQCSCGAQSPHLRSGVARKRWHASHKDEVRAVANSSSVRTERTSGVVLDEDGFALDEWGQPFGTCNSCGEEAPAYSDCCEDGEVVPYPVLLPNAPRRLDDAR